MVEGMDGCVKKVPGGTNLKLPSYVSGSVVYVFASDFVACFAGSVALLPVSSPGHSSLRLRHAMLLIHRVVSSLLWMIIITLCWQCPGNCLVRFVYRICQGICSLQLFYIPISGRDGHSAFALYTCDHVTVHM